MYDVKLSNKSLETSLTKLAGLHQAAFEAMSAESQILALGQIEAALQNVFSNISPSQSANATLPDHRAETIKSSLHQLIATQFGPILRTILFKSAIDNKINLNASQNDIATQVSELLLKDRSTGRCFLRVTSEENPGGFERWSRGKDAQLTIHYFQD